jgi:hypothetical protein
MPMPSHDHNPGVDSGLAACDTQVDPESAEVVTVQTVVLAVVAVIFARVTVQ